MATFISQMNKLLEQALFWGIERDPVMSTYQGYYETGEKIFKFELSKQFYAEFSSWTQLGMQNYLALYIIASKSLTTSQSQLQDPSR